MFTFIKGIAFRGGNDDIGRIAVDDFLSMLSHPKHQETIAVKIFGLSLRPRGTTKDGKKHTI
jgi:hypothetical protein